MTGKRTISFATSSACRWTGRRARASTVGPKDGLPDWCLRTNILPNHRRGAARGSSAPDRPDKLHPPVFEYLAQEVFSLLPPDLRDFLLRTSITNSLPLRLIQELTGLPLTTVAGKGSVLSVLQELQNRNLFISVADDAAVVRYHSLFQEFSNTQLNGARR